MGLLGVAFCISRMFEMFLGSFNSGGCDVLCCQTICVLVVRGAGVLGQRSFYATSSRLSSRHRSLCHLLFRQVSVRMTGISRSYELLAVGVCFVFLAQSGVWVYNRHSANAGVAGCGCDIFIPSTPYFLHGHCPTRLVPRVSWGMRQYCEPGVDYGLK